MTEKNEPDCRICGGMHHPSQCVSSVTGYTEAPDTTDLGVLMEGDGDERNRLRAKLTATRAELKQTKVELAAALAERDAYRKAKAENDERYMGELRTALDALDFARLERDDAQKVAYDCAQYAMTVGPAQIVSPAILTALSYKKG